MVKLDNYERKVREIRRFAYERNISESDVNKVFENCFKKLKHREAKRTSISAGIIIKYTFLFAIISTLCAILSLNHPPTMNLLMRNSQNFIYPGMKVFRQLAVPILNRFPYLTEWYDEWCILENPYFRVADMDCQPCRTVNTIPDLSGLNISSTLNVGLPFVTLESTAEVELRDILRIYKTGKDVFDRDASVVTSNNNSYRSVKDLVAKRLDKHPSRFKNTRVVWRINRMTPGQIIRKLFPKPEVTPNWWGQSTEKFVLIEEPKSPAYSLPNTECSNVILKFGSGERIIKLLPSPECQQECRAMEILLTAKQTLWYNWWYWRPVSLPTTNSTSISISYLTSFC